jgi:hypothetical protein
LDQSWEVGRLRKEGLTCHNIQTLCLLSTTFKSFPFSLTHHIWTLHLLHRVQHLHLLFNIYPNPPFPPLHPTLPPSQRHIGNLNFTTLSSTLGQIWAFTINLPYPTRHTKMREKERGREGGIPQHREACEGGGAEGVRAREEQCGTSASGLLPRDGVEESRTDTK